MCVPHRHPPLQLALGDKHNFAYHEHKFFPSFLPPPWLAPILKEFTKTGLYVFVGQAIINILKSLILSAS